MTFPSFQKVDYNKDLLVTVSLPTHKYSVQYRFIWTHSFNNNPSEVLLNKAYDLQMRFTVRIHIEQMHK